MYRHRFYKNNIQTRFRVVKIRYSILINGGTPLWPLFLKSQPVSSYDTISFSSICAFKTYYTRGRIFNLTTIRCRCFLVIFIWLFFINEIKEGKTQRGCGIVQKLVKLLQNLHFLFYFNSLKMTNKLKRTLISNLPKEKLFFVQAFNSHESLVLF